MNKITEILISYEEGKGTKYIVNDLIKDLKAIGPNFKTTRDPISDKKGQKISDFMGGTYEGKCVILIISDSFLESTSCMDKVLGIEDEKVYNDRIFPIILKDAEKSLLNTKAPFKNHWNKMVKDYNDLIIEDKSHEKDQEFQHEHKLRKGIEKGIDSFIKFINSNDNRFYREEENKNKYLGVIEKIKEAANPESIYVTRLDEQIKAQNKKFAGLINTSRDTLLSRLDGLKSQLDTQKLLINKILANPKTPEPVTPKKTLEIGAQTEGGRVFLKYKNEGGLIFSQELGSHKWEEAKEVCKNFDGGGHDNWRLPNKDELTAMFKEKDNIDGFDSGTYWSYTELETHNSYAYRANIGNGKVDWLEKSKHCGVRAVREF